MMAAGDDDEDFDVVEHAPSTDEIDQGYGMCLAQRTRLTLLEMGQLKQIIDTQINQEFMATDPQYFNVQTAEISPLHLRADHPKLTNIPVRVETLKGRVLVKVGPCDLSGVGGHLVREQIIKNLVNQALKAKGYMEHTYETVNVSACVGVRGRAQMARSFFASTREQVGSHMNAYVKTENEQTLTHWEPRNGPQHWYNDTICSMVTSVVTSVFEKQIREQSVASSAQATESILKNPTLMELFDKLLARTKQRITFLVQQVKIFVGLEPSADPQISDRSCSCL
jgi:hypothetical protein